MMRQLPILLFISFILTSLSLSAQQNSENFSVPLVNLNNLEGENVLSADLQEFGHPYMICFWKTCCKSTNLLMETLDEILPELTENYGLKVYAVSVDDSRTINKVKPYVNGKGWEVEVLLDVNGDLKRGMNVNLTPHYFIFDASDHLVWQKSGFSPGDEDQLFEILEKLKNGDTIE